MTQVLLYSGLLVGGLVVSQLADLSSLRVALSTVTMVCLAYIMIAAAGLGATSAASPSPSALALGEEPARRGALRRLRLLTGRRGGCCG